MRYHDQAAIMDRKFSLEKPSILLEEMDQEIVNIPFESNIHDIMPKETDVITENPAFLALMKFYLGRSEASNEHIFKSLTVADRDIPENNHFTYPFLKPRGVEKCDKIIILFHGLNERTWNKYLPWASSLAENTGCGVILFPMAFHMNRAPKSWSTPRSMIAVARERKALLPDVKGASFANTAISYRLQFAPQRFLLSGFQTLSDVVQLVEIIRRGDHPGIASSTKLNLFGYSIGATLSEVLMMANPLNCFTDSRAFLFCGGSSIDRITPVSRGILDNHAFKSIMIYFSQLVRDRGEKDSLLTSFTSWAAGCLDYFKSILIYDEMREKREGRFMEICRRMKSLSLRNDTVITPEAISTTLEGRYGNIPADLETMDFPYPYSHEIPFPTTEGEEVDAAFSRVFHRAADFLAFT